VTTWVLLLRGINVGGNNRLSMRELAAHLEGLGLLDVRTYIQSGNVVFAAGDQTPVDAASLAAAITSAIREAHGFTPRSLLLEASALRAAIDANPFPEAVAAPTTLHVLFLAAVPTLPDLAGLDALRGPRDRYVLDRTVLYLHLPEGIAGSRLAERAERLLGVPATARNWNTVRKLGELAGAPMSGHEHP
jgi:uncharacterized protein (DUF1697 family)